MGRGLGLDGLHRVGCTRFSDVNSPSGHGETLESKPGSGIKANLGNRRSLDVPEDTLRMMPKVQTDIGNVFVDPENPPVPILAKVGASPGMVHPQNYLFKVLCNFARA